MQAIRPLKPRLARRTIPGEFTYKASSMVARGRISSMRCSRTTLAAMLTVRQATDTAVVRCREVIEAGSRLGCAKSFQVPALEDKNRAAERHRGIKQGI